jgi:activator of HSP90 ATPase
MLTPLCALGRHHRVLGLQAYVAMRKGGKKLGVFDLNIEVKWEGKGEVDGDKVEGTLSIAEFATESDEDDWMIDCSTASTGKDAVRSFQRQTQYSIIHLSEDPPF